MSTVDELEARLEKREHDLEENDQAISILEQRLEQEKAEKEALHQTMEEDARSFSRMEKERDEARQALYDLRKGGTDSDAHAAGEIAAELAKTATALGEAMSKLESQQEQVKKSLETQQQLDEERIKLDADWLETVSYTHLTLPTICSV